MSDPSPRRGRPAFVWLALVAGAALLGLQIYGAALAWRYADVTTHFGWDAELRNGTWVMTEVDPRGPAKGLAVGDQLVAVDGDSHLGPTLWLHFIGGGPYALLVRRNGQEVRVSAAIEARPAPGRVLGSVLPQIANSLGVVALAVLVGCLKPEDRVARLLSLLGFMAGASSLAAAIAPYAPLMTRREWTWLALCELGAPFDYALCFHFFSTFPPSIGCGRTSRTARGLLYAWAGVVWVVSQLCNGLLLLDPPTAWALDAAHPWLAAPARTVWVFILVAIGASVTVMARRYWLVTEPHAARQVRWIAFGTAIGLLAEGVQGALWTLGLVTGRDALVQGALYGAADAIGPWLRLLTPIAFGYALLRHRLLDVRVVLRRGTQYLLARSALSAAFVLPLVLLALSVLTNPDVTLAQVVLRHPTLVALAAAAGLGLRFRAPLQRWVDRRFFREAYDRELLLVGLLEDLKACASLDAVSALACRRIEDALHPRGIRLLFRDAWGRLGVTYSSGDSTLGDLPPFSALLRVLEATGRAQQISGMGLPEDERALLAGFGASFVAPIGGGPAPLAGLILLGEKRSEEPYTATDVRLLAAVTGQIAIVSENVALRERVLSDERVRREVLARLEGRGLRPLRECPTCGRCSDGDTERCEADGHPLELSLPVERTIEGKYRLERLLGKGGMGAVYEATDLRLGRLVAVKVAVGRLFGDAQAMRRFEREARAAARLEHPNIVTIYDYGDVGGGAYLVMERLQGHTLRVELARNGPPAPAVAADWLEQVLAGVQAAHESGIVHRDLKPENVLLAEEGGRRVAKILDFGLAQVLLPEDTAAARLTLPGTLLGTLSYMAPEQLAGQPTDVRTDIFALGVMAVEVVTGQHPFVDRAITSLPAAILSDRIGLPGSSAEERALDAVIQRCVAKDASVRFASVAELKPALLDALRRCPRIERGRVSVSEATTLEAPRRPVPIPK